MKTVKSPQGRYPPSNPSIWRRLQGLLEVHEPDEREREVQALAIRNGYLATGITALSVSLYRELFMGQAGLIWLTVFIVVLSTLVPLARGLFAGGLAPEDERIRHLQTRAFRWAIVLLFLGLYSLGVYRGIGLHDVDSGWSIMLSTHAATVVTLQTGVSYNTIRGTSRGWLVGAILFLCALIYGIGLIWIVGWVLKTTPAASPGILVYGAAMSAFAVAQIVIALLAARRRWREEQAERDE